MLRRLVYTYEPTDRENLEKPVSESCHAIIEIVASICGFFDDPYTNYKS